ncbi:MAG: AmmeMemoRadiSam system protein B [Balneolaceae bacterium]
MCPITPDEAKRSLRRSADTREPASKNIRILFVPSAINSDNADAAADLYQLLSGSSYETVVVVESRPGAQEKKLPMPSNHEFTTGLGSVIANDRLRNELCDEDDDFFIDDSAFSESSSLYDQLPFLQTVLSDFSMLSLQITDESPAIVKELASAFEEILASRNALLLFCCDFSALQDDQIATIWNQYNEQNRSGLMNSLSSDWPMTGAGALFAGLLISGGWGLTLHPCENRHFNGMPCAAEVQHQPIFG